MDINVLNVEYLITLDLIQTFAHNRITTITTQSSLIQLLPILNVLIQIRQNFMVCKRARKLLRDFKSLGTDKCCIPRPRCCTATAGSSKDRATAGSSKDVPYTVTSLILDLFKAFFSVSES
jgi:hypothetical protein